MRTEYAYPAARTGRTERTYVECECGHLSYGTKFVAVWSEDPKDAWYQHRLHMDALCPERRTPWGAQRPLRVSEALEEIRRILDRVEK